MRLTLVMPVTLMKLVVILFLLDHWQRLLQQQTLPLMDLEMDTLVGPSVRMRIEGQLLELRLQGQDHYQALDLIDAH